MNYPLKQIEEQEESSSEEVEEFWLRGLQLTFF